MRSPRTADQLGRQQMPMDIMGRTTTTDTAPPSAMPSQMQMGGGGRQTQAGQDSSPGVSPQGSRFTNMYPPGAMPGSRPPRPRPLKSSAPPARPHAPAAQARLSTAVPTMMMIAARAPRPARPSRAPRANPSAAKAV